MTTLEIANPATLAVDKMLLIANPATLAVDDMLLECDPSLMALGDGGKSILLLRHILLDNGSNQCILNHFYRLLYISLNNLIGKKRSGGPDDCLLGKRFFHDSYLRESILLHRFIQMVISEVFWVGIVIIRLLKKIVII